VPRALSYLLVAPIAAVALSLATSAHAGPSVEPAAVDAPTVDFVDTADLSVELPRLLAHGLKVEVVNKLASPQKVLAKVSGLTAVDGKDETYSTTLFASDDRQVTDTIPPSSSKILTIAPGKPVGTPSAGGYTATLIAIGKRGGAVRRKLSLLPAAQTPQPVTPAASLTKDSVAKVKISGTNYAPSFLSPVGAGLITLGIAAALTAWALWATLNVNAPALLLVGGFASITLGATRFGAFGERGLSHEAEIATGVLYVLAGLTFFVGLSLLVGIGRDVKGRNVVAVAGALCLAMFLAGALIETPGADSSGQPTAGLVSIRSLPVADTLPAGRGGVAINGDGAVTELRVTAEHRLTASPLTHAGTYDGKVDLNGTEEGGSTDATVTVADWWLWAFLTLALGVAIAYQVRRYFEQGRTRADALRRLDSAWARVSREDSDYQSVTAGEPHNRLRITEIARARVRLGQELANSDDTAGATKSATDLDEYATAFAGLRREVVHLAALRLELNAAKISQDFGTTSPFVAMVTADELLRRNDLDADDPDADKSRLTALLTEVRSAAALAGAVLGSHWVFAHHLDEAENAHEEEWAKKFRDIGRRLTEQRDPAEINKLAVEEAGLWDGFCDAMKAAVARGDKPKEDVLVLATFELDDGLLRTRTLPILPLRNVAPVAAAIAVRTVGPDTTRTATHGDGDDEFDLGIHVTNLPSDAPIPISWDFGDGSDPVTETLIVSGGSAEARIRHRFRGTESFAVIRVISEGADIASQRIDIDRPGRTESARRTLALRDREIVSFAGLLAVGSGMATLYFAKQDWGSNGDYLTALLWGGTGTAGIAAIGNLVAKKFGGPAA
jgi:hypothetical protein